MATPIGALYRYARDKGFDGALSSASPYIGAGLLAAGASEDADASFGGVLAKTADPMMLALAREMKRLGKSREDIWEKSGWDLDNVDGMPRFEIQDDLEMDIDGLSWGSAQDLAESLSTTAPLGDFVKSDAISDNYQGLLEFGDDGVRGVGRIVSGLRGGSYDPKLRSIEIGVEKVPTKYAEKYDFTPEHRSIMAHEMQHDIQRKEGFATGGNPDGPYRGSELSDTTRRIYNELKDNPANANDADDAILAHAHKLANSPDARRKNYLQQAGETEARNVQTRLDYTPEQRRMFPPWATQDVPDSEQIVRRERGNADPTLLGAISTGALGAAEQFFRQPEPNQGLLGRLANGLVGGPTGALAGYLSTMMPGEVEEGGILDRWRNLGIDAPAQGIYGLVGALSGGDGGTIAQQPINQTADQFEEWMLRHGVPALPAKVGKVGAEFWGPI